MIVYNYFMFGFFTVTDEQIRISKEIESSVSQCVVNQDPEFMSTI